MVIGEPGSGKSAGSARDAVGFPGAVIVSDPHSGEDSLARRVLPHLPEGKWLYDRLTDLEHPLGFELLRPSAHSDPRRRAQLNERRAATFVEFLMRRRGGDAAASPLIDEWLTALLSLFLSQVRPKPLSMLPFGFLPGTDEFRALVRDCPLPEIRVKFQQLEKLTPRGLRAEVGAADRVIRAVFRNQSFLARCDGGAWLPKFIQSGGKIVIEAGGESEDVKRTFLCGVSLLVTEHCETRPVPYPPVRIYLEECTNARTAGRFEEQKAGETRKAGLSWTFICQWPNFPNGPEGFFQNCQRKEVYRCSDHGLARKLAAMIAPGLERGEEESRAEQLAWLTDDIMRLQTGWRYVTDRSGSRKEHVEMLENPWPAWGGGMLQRAKLEEQLCRVYARPEYSTPAPPPFGEDEMPGSSPGSPSSPPPPPKSPTGGSPAERFKRRGGIAPRDGS